MLSAQTVRTVSELHTCRLISEHPRTADSWHQGSLWRWLPLPVRRMTSTRCSLQYRGLCLAGGSERLQNNTTRFYCNCYIQCTRDEGEHKFDNFEDQTLIFITAFEKLSLELDHPVQTPKISRTFIYSLRCRIPCISISLRCSPVFGVCGRFRGVKRRKPLHMTFFHLRGSECGDFFPVWGHRLTPFVRKHFCICARCLSPHKCRIHAHKRIEPAQMQGWHAQTAILHPIRRCQHTIIYAPIVGRILQAWGSTSYWPAGMAWRYGARTSSKEVPR